MLGPCEWPALYSACGGLNPDGTPACEPLASMDPDEIAQFERMAGEYLNNWTGGRFGQCLVTIRPCRQNCWDGVSTYNGAGPTGNGTPFTPVLIRGSWFNLGCGTCGDTCGCYHTPTLTLPGPVSGVEQIVIGGDVLPPSAYRVDNWRYLTRTDGGDWPTCQDLTAPSGPAEPQITDIDPISGTAGTTVTVTGSGFQDVPRDDTFEITYLRGREVPLHGQVAAGMLACELAKDACGDKSCRLPRRVSSIDRQGTSIVFDDFNDLDRGRTGIWVIDSWISSVTQAPRSGRVRSPDLPRVAGRVTNWP